MSLLQNSNAIQTVGGYNITNSLRLRSSASAYLSRTLATDGNRSTWTWSAWIKRGIITPSNGVGLFGAGTINSGTNNTAIRFTAGDALALNSASGDYRVTTRLFRDPSAWYHIVVAFDTTQATGNNRVRMYVNGVEETSFSTLTNPALNSTADFINNNRTHHMGVSYATTSLYDDRYQAETHFIDGQQLTPTSFGETDTDTGVWKPKAYTGTYGTQGFYLNFSDIATTSGSNAGLGKDFSGNGNYWTTNNISVTSGATYDAMTDSPTNTSTTVANYATLNPLTNLNGATLTDGNLTWSQPSTTTAFVSSTISLSQNYTYLEFTTTDADRFLIGVTTNATRTATTDLGASSNEYAFQTDGNKINGGTTTSYGSSVASGATGCIAFDNVNNKIYVGSISGTTITWFNSGDPVSGTNPMFTVTAGTYFLGIQRRTNTTTVYLNFGQRPFLATNIPTGFVRLNTFNLPTSTIVKGNSYMEATTYTGDGNANRNITSLNFQPDLIWIKARNTTNGANRNNQLFDSVRGVPNALSSNLTSPEDTAGGYATDGCVSAILSNGFTLDSGNPAVNWSGSPYIAWSWDAGSSTVTNTSGSISAQVRANTTTGFSVVTYTGTGANATVGHGLGVAPKMMLVKGRSNTDNWQVYHSNLTSADYRILLNSTAAETSQPAVWNSTAPTSSVFSLGTGTSVNQSGQTFVAYCWAEIAGFSKFGSYTGNGNANGPFVYLGFRPKFVLIKVRGSANDWGMYDSSRDPSNLAGLVLRPNVNNAEVSASNIDFLSNGFKLRNNAATTEYNGNGSIYIYMAFAENPFKNSLAR